MFFKFIIVLCWIMCLTHFTMSLSYEHDNVNYTNRYGKDYGTKWIYFPDGDGEPHYVNLRQPINSIDMRGDTTTGIEFRLYIGNNTNSYIVLNEFGKPVKEIYQETTFRMMSSNTPLKIITHGWKSSADKEGVIDVKNTYLESTTVNVITIDWSGIADSIFYPWVAYESQIVGLKVAKFINAIHKSYNITGKQLHLIGHSLGAHIMGIAASRSNLTVDRITGLDPARPLFEYPVIENLRKLLSTDADFVDVIHTCRGVLGYDAPVGTIDFYPNNGFPPQPGCGSIQKMYEACSHGRSFHYFSESIKYPMAFPANQCQNWFDYILNSCNNHNYMGESVNRKFRGIYYLQTNSEPPYGLYSNLRVI